MECKVGSRCGVMRGDMPHCITSQFAFHNLHNPHALHACSAESNLSAHPSCGETDRMSCPKWCGAERDRDPSAGQSRVLNRGVCRWEKSCGRACKSKRAPGRGMEQRGCPMGCTNKECSKTGTRVIRKRRWEHTKQGTRKGTGKGTTQQG